MSIYCCFEIKFDQNGNAQFDFDIDRGEMTESKNPGIIISET